MRARLIISRRDPFSDGSFVALKVWQVPPSPRTPEGFKYSFVFIDKDGRRVLGYDNAEGKGHHRHEGGRETPLAFTTVDALLGRFQKEVKERRRAKS
jgi:hypothetical protein